LGVKCIHYKRGEIHTHTSEVEALVPALDANLKTDVLGVGGCTNELIQQEAKEEGFDFVAVSINVTATGLEYDAWGKGSSTPHGPLLIASREIQNNEPYSLNCLKFSSTDPDNPSPHYMHPVTLIGGPQRSLSFTYCAHPGYYGYALGADPDLAIRSVEGQRDALLYGENFDAQHPNNLDTFSITGVEIYNSFTMFRYRDTYPALDKESGRSFEEQFFDGLLSHGKFCYATAGNDAFFSKEDAYSAYRQDKIPLGSVYVANASDDKDVIESLQQGEFYSSSGITLNSLTQTDARDSLDNKESAYRIEASKEVLWQCYLFQPKENKLMVWESAKPQADFEISHKRLKEVSNNKWAYFRVQCRDPENPESKAWLQPVKGPEWESCVAKRKARNPFCEPVVERMIEARHANFWKVPVQQSSSKHSEISAPDPLSTHL
jgi:hypothetical protein